MIGNEAHEKASYEVASKSVVLLKNESNLLPLDGLKSIGVIGPLAKDKDTPLGNWRANAAPKSAVSLLEGLQKALSDSMKINYAEGCKLSIGPNNFIQEVVIEREDRSGFPEAIRVARESEVVIMALGEPAYMSGEARSRADIGLPGLQLELLQEIYEVNKNVVLVLMNGRPLTLPWEYENIPSILEAWHLGSQAGNAIADVLTGKVNPSGKLPMSFPRHVGQLPLYYNHLNSGRPESDLIFYVHHMDVENTPLIPFGFGLSYTSFEYYNLKVSPSGSGLKASILVKNTGSEIGEEVVQLYLRDLVASVSRPVLELRGFNKITLRPGEEKKVDFELNKEALSFYDREGNLVFEPGVFMIGIGTNSSDLMTENITIN